MAMIDPHDDRWHCSRKGGLMQRTETRRSHCPVCSRKYERDMSMVRFTQEPYDDGDKFIYLECRECGLRILLRDDFSTLPGGKRAGFKK